MADRSIVVRLRAETNDFKREMGKATSSLDEMVKKSGDSSGAANTTMGRLVQSARLQSDAWTTVGATIGGAGAALTALNLSVAKTGADYNTLQQTSRAALTTLLGGAQQANAQMDKLDAFARTSPFSKQTFITAQQQMLAFGIEAEKVIPYLDGINEAVAAAGGSSQMLGEVAFVMAQISAAGKITATDLMQLGQRGVNAAELIGSEMGKTGAEIKAMITKGTLGADQALDALAAGMKKKFDGASANVKNTMGGALDRLSAAWRDFSASMMSTAVDPNGGGWLVDLTNNAASAIRMLDSLPQPIKNVTGLLSALTGAAALAGGGFIALAPQVVAARDAWKTLEEASPRLTGALSGIGKAAGVATAALAALQIAKGISDMFREAAPAADAYTAAIERVAAGTGNLESLFAGTFEGSLIRAPMSNIAEAMKAYDRGVNDIIGRFTGLHDEADVVIDRFKRLDAALASASPEKAAAAYRDLRKAQEEAGWSSEKLNSLLPAYIGKLDTAAAAAGRAELSHEELAEIASGNLPEGLVMTSKGLMDVTQAAQSGADGQSMFADWLERSNARAKEQVNILMEARQEINSFYDGVINATRAEMSLEQSFDKATESINKNGRTLDISTEKGRNNKDALISIAEAAYKNAEAMAKNGASTEEIIAKTQRARDEFIKSARAMGASSEEANNLANELGLIPGDVATRVELPGINTAQYDTERFKALLNSLPAWIRPLIKVEADLDGYYRADKVLNSINGKVVTATVAIKQYGQAAIATGGLVGDVAHFASGGIVRRRFDSGGIVHGPGTPTSDDVPAMLSRSEFVQRAAAVEYYGAPLMYALNSKRIPREYFKPLGFAQGGSLSAAPQGGSMLPMPMDTSAITDAVRDGLAGVQIVIDGRVIDARLEAAGSRIRRGLR